MEHRFQAKAVWLMAALALSATGLWAQDASSRPELPASPTQLVRQAVANQMRDSGTPYLYKLVNRKPDATETRQMVDVNGGVLGRLVTINGKPLTPEQRAKEDRRLQRLINDGSAWEDKKKSQAEDDARTRKMLNALPDAFLYQYAGTGESPYGEIVTLKFQPNPAFNPPSRETMVYRGMQGEMQIAVPADHIVKIEARLFRDVNFGWGILGHLDSGGQFVVEQAPVLNGDWQTTHMVLNFTGKALFFKTIKIRQDETASDFELAPRDLSLSQGLELLKKKEAEIAESSPAK